MKSSKATSSEMDSKPDWSRLVEVKVEGREIHKGKSFSFCTDTVKLPDGSLGKKDYVKYPQAVAVIPFVDPATLILIRQFRYPVNQVIFEIPAGKMEDPEETRLEAAQRELLEETGYRAKCFDYLFSYYPCVGYSTEIIHIFKASELTKESQYLDEDEFIEPEKILFSDAMEMVRKGEIKDSKTIISLLYLKSFMK